MQPHNVVIVHEVDERTPVARIDGQSGADISRIELMAHPADHAGRGGRFDGDEGGNVELLLGPSPPGLGVLGRTDDYQPNRPQALKQPSDLPYPLLGTR